MIKENGSNAKFPIVESNVSIFTTLSPGHAEAKTPLKTLWGYVGIATTKYTLEQN